MKIKKFISIIILLLLLFIIIYDTKVNYEAYDYYAAISDGN